MNDFIVGNGMPALGLPPRGCQDLQISNVPVVDLQVLTDEHEFCAEHAAACSAGNVLC